MSDPNSLPLLFKGIALFTPGGDVVYCIDPDKQTRWHLHLCQVLQEVLNLPEPPHFLVPGYAATLDRWRNPQTQQIEWIAEAAPAVLRYQALLNTFFETPGLEWQASVLPEVLDDRAVLETYRQQFPKLWQAHDVVMRCDLRNLGDRPDSWQPLGTTSQPSTTSQPTTPFAQSGQEPRPIQRRQPQVPPPETRAPEMNPPEPDQGEARPETVGPEAFSQQPSEPHASEPLSSEQSGYVLRLFVSGSSRATVQTLTNLHRLLEQVLDQPYTLKLVDVLQHPEQAEQDQVTATPTLVKVWPRPLHRIVGKIETSDQLMQLLESPPAY